MVNIVALTDPINEEMYQDYGNNMLLLPSFTGLLPYIGAVFGNSSICIGEACLEDSRWSQPMKKEKKEDQEHTAFRPGLFIKITVFTEEEDGEEMLKTVKKKQGSQLQQKTETLTASSVKQLVIGPETVLTTTTMNLLTADTNSRGEKDTITNAQGVQLLPSQTEATSRQWMGGRPSL